MCRQKAGAVGNQLSYRVTPMIGQPDQLKEDEANASPWVSVVLGASAGPEANAFFNRGVILSQFVSRYAKQHGLDTTQALKRDSQQEGGAGDALLAPELNRRKEPLEAYPLDSMVMVGSLIKKGQPVALIRVDNLLYQVKPGNYLGQNYGKITRVGESEVVLRELVQDAAGDWVERTATLQLQEKSK